jgi:alpha-glucosidase
LRVTDTPVEVVCSQETGRTVRVDILPLDGEGKPQPAPPSMVLDKTAADEKLRVRDVNGPARLTAAGMNVTVTTKPLTIRFQRPDGRLVQQLTFKNDGSFSFHTEAPTFGLGEGRQQFDRRGFFYNFQNGQNTLLATHGATVPSPFLIGADGWGMFIHNPPPAGSRQPNTAWGQFDLRGDDVPPIAARGRGAAGADTNLTPPEIRPTRGRYIPRPDTLNQAPTSIFVMNLDAPAEALAEYTHLVGKPAMPPKWALGYMQSHRSLQGPDEVLGVAQRLREDQIPCDVLIYLGTGYTIATQPNVPLGGWNLRNGSLEFNPAIFNKPQEMIDQLHALTFKICLHKTNAPTGLWGDVHDVSNDPNNVSNYWATHVPLMKMGVDTWWPDDGDELPVENRLARIKAYYEGPLKDFPQERPWSLDRNGYSGVAKYGGWNWSGDVTSTWATLQAHVPMGIQSSLSLSPWWGTDIGGFNGAPEYSGELYARWFEFGAFCPLFRSHGRNWHLHTPWGWDQGEPGPRESTLPAAGTDYHNKEVEPACQKADNLRYQLLPYNYTIAREACDTGMPLMRALFLSYPHDVTAVALGDEYLWGPNLLVAPVIERGATQRRLYLPEGQWYDFHTGEQVPTAPGGRWISKPVTLDTIPLYVRAGAILPTDPTRQYTAERVGPTTLTVYPGADGAFSLYDDDGHTEAYKTNHDPQMQWIRMTWNDAVRTLTLEVDPRQKIWPAGMTRKFQVTVLGGPTRQVEFAGQRLPVILPARIAN